MSLLQKQKIAIVHDWLTGIGGADRVVLALHELFPDAPIYTLIQNKEYTDKYFPTADIRVSPLQKIYNIVSRVRLLLPFMPSQMENFDLSMYDVVISSSVIYAKGLVLKPQTLHVAYCHSPTRQVWDWSTEYRAEHPRRLRIVMLISQHILRLWDYPASTRPSFFIANSNGVRNRIRKYYGREAKLVRPPVAVPMKLSFDDLGFKNFYLIVSRLHRHKNVDLAIRVFNKLGWNLVVVGQGPELSRLRKTALPNIKLVGYLDDETIQQYYAGCKAFIMPQEEDAGISPIEAMMHGKPVLALRRGGATEIIQEGVNGEFFDAPVEGVFANGVRIIDKKINSYDKEAIMNMAKQYSTDVFQKNIRQYVLEKVYEKQSQSLHPSPSV